MIYRPESVLASPLAAGVDVMGPAFLADRYRTVLEFLAYWPDRPFSRMPVRTPGDWHSLRDCCRKLKLFGCIENFAEDGRQLDGVYHLTLFGFNVLSLWRTGLVKDFHAVHLLQTALNGRGSNWSTNLVRVALRLVAMIEAGPRLCGRDDFDVQPSVEQLQDQSIGVGRFQASLGGLWSSLGIWQKVFSEGRVDQKNALISTMGPIMVNGSAALDVNLNVEEYETRCSYRPVVEEARETALTPDEVAVLEDALLWAFIDQVAFFNCQNGRWFDVATMCEVQPGPSQLIDAVELSERPENAAGFFATYGSVKLEGEVLVVRHVTAVPQRAIRQVVAQTGLPFTRALATQYPTST